MLQHSRFAHGNCLCCTIAPGRGLWWFCAARHHWPKSMPRVEPRSCCARRPSSGLSRAAHDWFIMSSCRFLQAMCARFRQTRLLERRELRVLPSLHPWRVEASTKGEACTAACHAEAGQTPILRATVHHSMQSCTVVLSVTTTAVALIAAGSRRSCDICCRH